jgi:hypothetical protein
MNTLKNIRTPTINCTELKKGTHNCGWGLGKVFKTRIPQLTSMGMNLCAMTVDNGEIIQVTYGG